MTKHSAIKLFEHKRIRFVWDDEAGTWFYSVVDVVGILTDQPDTKRASTYWRVLKNRLSKESCEPVTICNRLKLPAEDGKMRLTDIADTKGILRGSVGIGNGSDSKAWSYDPTFRDYCYEKTYTDYSF